MKNLVHYFVFGNSFNSSNTKWTDNERRLLYRRKCSLGIKPLMIKSTIAVVSKTEINGKNGYYEIGNRVYFSEREKVGYAYDQKNLFLFFGI